MLDLGIPPAVSASTSAFMVLFASASAALSFLADGRLKLAYAAAFGAVSCVAAFLGVFVLAAAINRHGASLVVFLLAGVVTIGAVSTAVFNGRHTVEQFISGHLDGFHSMCQHPGAAAPGGGGGGDLSWDSILGAF